MTGCVISKKNDNRMLLHRQKYHEPELIDENAIFGMPYGSAQNSIIEKMGQAKGKFNFVNNRIGLLYGKYILLLQDERLCGIYICTLPELPFISLTKGFPSLPEWNFMGINQSSSFKSVSEKFAKYLKTDMRDKIIFSTKKLDIAIGINERNTPRESISYLLICQKSTPKTMGALGTNL